LIEAQEQERARIARELHNDLAQRVAILNIQPYDLGQKLPTGTRAQSRVQQISDQATELARELQVVPQGLHSESPELLSLSTAAANLSCCW
jgi:signal transduction histidine kinase